MITRSRIPLGAFGLIGSFAPSVIKMFNDLPNVAFLFKWQWVVVVLLYGFLGGLIAIIYPYRRKPTAWKALLIGCAFPALIGSAAGFVRAAGLGPGLGTGPEVPWTFWDYIALF
jgi:hypothetical protein